MQPNVSLRIAYRAAFLLFILLLATAPQNHLQAQQPVSPDEPIRINTDFVVLDVQVVSKNTGQSVGELKREDFLIYEDGVSQEITHFSQDRLPLSIVLLVDTSSSVWPFVKQMRDGALKALQQLKPEDEVALIATASKTELVQEFVRDRQLIIDKIQTLNEKAFGEDGILLHNALYQAATYLAKASNPISRRVIIVLTDDIPTQLPSVGHSENEAVRELDGHKATVCGLIVGRLRYQPFFIISRKLLSLGSIETYAKKTGGLVLHARKEEVEEKLGKLIEHLRTRYTIGYAPSNKKRDGSFRQTRVKLSPNLQKQKDKLNVLTRPGYYARRD